MVDIYILMMYYLNMRSRDRLIIQTSQRIQKWLLQQEQSPQHSKMVSKLKEELTEFIHTLLKVRTKWAINTLCGVADQI